MGKNHIATYKLNTMETILLWIMYGILYLISLLPLRLLYILSDACFLLVYHIFKYRREIVRKNLRNAFPEKNEEERSIIERKFFHFFCDYVFETIKLASISKKEMRRRMSYSGIERVHQALKDGHNVCLYLAHYCNWEWVTSIMLHLPDDICGGQVYHVLENKVMDKLMLKLRSKMGTINISRTELPRRIVTCRKAKQPMVIGFISDQGTELHNIRYWTQFLNQDTAVITGTETIAKKYDFVCFYLDIQRIRRGYYHVDVLPLTETTKEYPDFEITELYLHALEKSIRRQPDLWLWTHNRWKITPEIYQKFLESHKNNR